MTNTVLDRVLDSPFVFYSVHGLRELPGLFDRSMVLSEFFSWPPPPNDIEEYWHCLNSVFGPIKIASTICAMMVAGTLVSVIIRPGLKRRLYVKLVAGVCAVCVGLALVAISMLADSVFGLSSYIRQGQEELFCSWLSELGLAIGLQVLLVTIVSLVTAIAVAVVRVKRRQRCVRRHQPP